MSNQLYFAHLSDIHLCHAGDRGDILGGHAAGFLANVITQLNNRPELEFVLISGDLVNDALAAEFDQFDQLISRLKKPYYIIPGNHDRRDAEATVGLTRYEVAQRYNPQVSQRPVDGNSQAGYWSQTVKTGIQLIGLDSIRDADWGGEVDENQLNWLKQELPRHADKLVILTIHHPLHPLAPIDETPKGRNFYANNGAELIALLDQHPQCQLVLTGHHHCTRADMVGARLHLACPGIGIYPFAYRTIRLTQQTDQAWQVSWQTHPASDDKTVAYGRALMLEVWQEKANIPLEVVEVHADIAWGPSDYDRLGEMILSHH
ncbi:metallophosphoesterase [Anaerolineales bacterium HSG6]|nr:metallophosphoesterase [Anaerolineales bacterium HSG6]